MAVDDQDKAAGEQIARLYREAAREEPPPHLDSAIQRAARTSGRPRASRVQSWLRSWRLPFAFAAIAIVSVSLVTLVLEEGGERLTEIPRQRIAGKPEAAAELETAPPAARSVPSEQRARGDSAPPPAADRGPAREKAKALQDNSEPGKVGIAAVERQPRAEDSPPQPKAAAGEAAASRRSEGAPDVQKAPESPAPISASDNAESAGRSPAPAARPAPAPPSVEAAPAPPTGARMRKSETLANARTEAAAEIAKLEGQPPAAWRERIVFLRREGREAEADALLAEYKARFPGAVPPQSQ